MTLLKINEIGNAGSFQSAEKAPIEYVSCFGIFLILALFIKYKYDLPACRLRVTVNTHLGYNIFKLISI